MSEDKGLFLDSTQLYQESTNELNKQNVAIVCDFLARQLISNSYNPERIFSNLKKFFSSGGDFESLSIKIDENIITTIDRSGTCISPDNISKRLKDIGQKFKEEGKSHEAKEFLREAKWQSCDI